MKSEGLVMQKSFLGGCFRWLLFFTGVDVLTIGGVYYFSVYCCF